MLLGIGSYMFRYSIGTSNFHPEIPLDPITLIKKAKQLNVDVVQFAENLPLDKYDNQYLEKVKRNAINLNIKLEMGTAGASEENLFRYLKIANLLESKLLRITLHSDTIHPTKDEAMAVLRKVLPSYEASGVTIALENHFTMLSTDLVDIVRKINHPLIGICLDTANSIVQQEWPMDTVHLLSDYAVSLHLKDYKVTSHPDGIGVLVSGTPLGDGDQNITKILDYLRNKSFDATVILEQWMPQSTSNEATILQEEEWIQKSVTAARKFIDQAEKVKQ